MRRDDHSLLGHPRVGASWERFALEQTLPMVKPPQAFFWATYSGAELDLYEAKDRATEFGAGGAGGVWRSGGTDERCPVGAIVLKDDRAVVTAANCIGCGLCVTACPTEALSLVRREPLPEIPGTAQEMGMKVLTEKGKLEAFLLASKR